MTTKYHENLLRAMSQKQLLDSEPESEEVVEVEKESLESSKSSKSTPHPPVRLKKRRRKPQANNEISKKMMDTLAKVSNAIIKKTETSHTDNNRVESLAKEVEEVKNHLKK